MKESKAQQIKRLEEELKELREENLSMWKTYGSELCAGEMEADEKALEEKIKKLRKKGKSES